MSIVAFERSSSGAAPVSKDVIRPDMAVTDILALFNFPGRLIESVEEFNFACEHIVLLLEEAEVIFQREGYSTAVFLAITAIEETAKTHLGSFTAGGPDPEKRKNNIFYDHGKKHQMAAMPTVPMGTRLQAAIGDDVLAKIMNMSHSKELLGLRESSLYFERQDGVLRVPRATIDKMLSRAILLYAIEVFDDALVGFTDYSMKASNRTDALFDRIASA
ncbi:MAG: AbiV family abortive infection protein [Candidatus Competibacteraceae bacterium]|nr:AbiV family abortive infection protein [Candidatus Competibacteraceae bacterium]